MGWLAEQVRAGDGTVDRGFPFGRGRCTVVPVLAVSPGKRNDQAYCTASGTEEIGGRILSASTLDTKFGETRRITNGLNQFISGPLSFRPILTII